VVPQDFYRWYFTGFTYPDTSAGLTACNAKGQSLPKPPNANWACELGTPNANVYNLWALEHIVTGG
jgi:hypothetical protein